MLVVISPAKRLDFETPARSRRHSQPEFQRDSSALIDTLRGYSPKRLQNLMGISADLAALNHQRYQEWQPRFTPPDAKPAIEAFRGDVYMGLDAGGLSARDFTWAQKYVRILSGLHGVLRPLDLIRPYRLEMGTKLKTARGKDLYAYWGEQVTRELNDTLASHRSKVLINLASNEYFGVIRTDQLEARLINVTFKDLSKGRYRVLSFFAKKARGALTRFIVDERLTSPGGLVDFNWQGYAHCAESSTPDHLVFLRDTPPVANQRS